MLVRHSVKAMVIAILGALTIGASGEENTFANDMATVEACFALAAKNSAARGPHEDDALTEMPGPEGRLKAASEAAPREAMSCIGAVSAPCLQAGGYKSNAGMVQCYGRETEVWDARLNKAYKDALRNAEGEDVAEGYRKMQRAWIAFRDAACVMPWLIHRGTMANPLKAYCLMEKTARQALWFESGPTE